MSQPPIAPIFRRLPRGRPQLGFQLELPDGVALHEDGPVVRCTEVRGDRTLGVLEVSVFSAALIIDRDGIIAEHACKVLGQLVSLDGGARAMHVQLPAGTGARTEAIQRGPLPYVYVFTLAPPDLHIDGGLLITVRCATPAWEAADQILRSLRFVGRQGRVATVSEDADTSGNPLLPIIEPPRD